MFNESVEIQFPPNPEIVFELFLHFLESISNFEHFEKKKWASYLIYFRNYRLQKAWLLKCLKSPASEHLWWDNMLRYPKHYWNLHCSSFAIFFSQFETASVRKEFFLGKSECLSQPIQIQLCGKPRKFSQFYAKFLKSTSNLWHFENKRWTS